MHGIQRLPALLFDNPLTTLDKVGLDQYEVLNNELLHDISHHTQNLYDELPNHFPKKIKKSFKEIILASFNGKDAKISSDHRESLLIVCVWLMKIQPDHFVTKILLTHAEIQEILYKTDEYRSTTSILRLYSLWKASKTNDTDKSKILWILLSLSHQTRTRTIPLIFTENIKH